VTLEVGITTSRDAMDVRLRREAERLGATSVWLPEFWRRRLDPLGHSLRHRLDQARYGDRPARNRTPAMLAMTAMTLQELSNGGSCSASGQWSK